MSKTFTDTQNRALVEVTLSGATMGTRYAADFYAPETLDIDALKAALFQSVDRVDCQMSTWKADSDLMRVNAAPVNAWVHIPQELTQVLAKAIEIGAMSNGAFDIGVGDIVDAWGFGAGGCDGPDAASITGLLGHSRPPAHEVLELNEADGQVRKLGPISLDLSGIAKGFGVDEMTRCVEKFGIENALLSLDGELRAIGKQADDKEWTIAVEKPDYEVRSPHGVIALSNASVATSGDYRHWIDVGESRFSHTMNGRTGGPLQNAVASATVIAPECMAADAWATVLLVMGESAAVAIAEARYINALLIIRDGTDLREVAIGPAFNG